MYTCVCVYDTDRKQLCCDSNNKVLGIPWCSRFSAYKTGITICLVDIEMYHIIKHLEIVLLDIK